MQLYYIKHVPLDPEARRWLVECIRFCITVVLLDTTQDPALDWTRYPYGPQANTPGWVEESFTNFEKGINWRSYVVCDVAYNNVNNWLWTPFVERGNANRIYIEIKFTIRDCSLFPGNALSCKETFSLLYYEFDAATKEPPPWEPESYKLIALWLVYLFLKNIHQFYYFNVFYEIQTAFNALIDWNLNYNKLGNTHITLDPHLFPHQMKDNYLDPTEFKCIIRLKKYGTEFKCFIIR
uniref:Eph LBD domain-containing protein n=1 Tax=Timema monikensis TaxID=170555 RepID=A0A7R9E252_9NEOP|nr:unnamed protein product [Timema monikensis]